MRRYETLFIVTPDSSEEDLKAVAAKIQGVVTGMNGIVASYDEQGKKKLAYSVKKQNKGYYVLMDYVRITSYNVCYTKLLRSNRGHGVVGEDRPSYIDFG